jgi:modulator of FtsH protease
MEAWESFAVAQVGAAAVLAGLVFVGVSVNLERVLSLSSLPGRATETLVILLGLLIAASLLLVPGQSLTVFGLELLVIGVLDWIVVLTLQLRTRSQWDIEKVRFYVQRIVLSQMATLPFIIAGLAVLLRGEGGLTWLAVGTIGVFVVSFLNAWVLLVEINR